MNKIKANFSKNPSIEPSFCIEKCMVEMNNDHLVWCDQLNQNSELKFSEILNGDITEKIEGLKQVKENEEKRGQEKKALYC